MTERARPVPSPHLRVAPPQPDPRHGPTPQPAQRSNPAVPAPAPGPTRHPATFQEPPSHAPPGAPLFGPARPQALHGGGREPRPRRWPWVVAIVAAFLVGLAIPTGSDGFFLGIPASPLIEEHAGDPWSATVPCRITAAIGAVVVEEPGQEASCTALSGVTPARGPAGARPR
ncbi:hypothetical protein GCM10023201_33850 [Actinomycetospora corticicola]